MRRSDGPETYRDEFEQFLDQQIAPLVRAKVRQRRSARLDDQETKQAVLDFTLDRTAQSLGSFIDVYGREEYAAWVWRIIEAALAEPPRAPLDEAARRLPTWVEGKWLMLGNEQRWSFPPLPLEKVPVVLADGRTVLHYPWVREDWGAAFLLKTIELSFAEQGGDLVAALRLALEMASILLRRNYQLDDDECHKLLLSTHDLACWGTLAADLPEDVVAALEWPIPVGVVIGQMRSRVEMVGVIANEVVNLLRPVGRDIVKR